MKFLKKVANNLFFNSKTSQQVSITGIGKEKLSQIAQKAAVIYIFPAVKSYCEGKFSDSMFNTHSMYWESVEIVKILNKSNYIVDYYDCMQEHTGIDWSKYDLIIDERNNLRNCNSNKTIKVFYATGCHWLYHNIGEMKRLNSFIKRNKKYLLPRRQVGVYESSDLADYITYFGGDFQLNTYKTKAKSFPLCLSSTYKPKYFEKDIEESRKNFIWVGSRGAVHKGLDIVVEAFSKLPHINLFIAAGIEHELDFMDWLNKKMKECNNIKFLGWMDIASDKFHELASNCIATVYASTAEGGAGAVVQLMHWGIIPIVNKSTALRAEQLGLLIKHKNPQKQISSIIQKVNKLNSMSSVSLKAKSDKVKLYAEKFHTRQSFSDSFSKFIEMITNETD